MAAGSARLTEPGYLGSLAKPELERLAGGLNVDDGPELTKQRLVAAIVEAGGVRLNDLTKTELLRLARGRGATVRGSMTKQSIGQNRFDCKWVSLPRLLFSPISVYLCSSMVPNRFPRLGRALPGWLLFRNLFLQFIRSRLCFGYNGAYFRN